MKKELKVFPLLIFSYIKVTSSSSYHVPGTVVGPEDKELNNKIIYSFMKLTILIIYKEKASKK